MKKLVLARYSGPASCNPRLQPIYTVGVVIVKTREACNFPSQDAARWRHASRTMRTILVLIIALEAAQFSRGRLVGPGCCRTMGGGLRAWSEPSTAEAIAAKRVHHLPMSHITCAAHCAALKRCTHFELNMYGQPVHANLGLCSVFASGGYPVTTACRDGSAWPRMHCFEVPGGGSSPHHTRAQLLPP